MTFDDYKQETYDAVKRLAKYDQVAKKIMSNVGWADVNKWHRAYEAKASAHDERGMNRFSPASFAIRIVQEFESAYSEQSIA